MLAVSASAIGSRRCSGVRCGELGVVVGVAELVRGGLRRVDRAAPVEQHERAVADERHAERAADLALARRDVDPLLVERTVDEAAERRAVRRRTPSRTMPTPSSQLIRPGRDRQRRDEVPPRQRARRGRAGAPWCASTRGSAGSDASIADCIASNVGAATRCWRTATRRAGESQPRRRLTMLASPLIAFIAAAHAVATFGHAAISASYAGAPDGRVGVGGEAAHGRHRQSSRARRAARRRRSSCDVTSRCRRAHADEPVVDELGVQALLGLAHLVLRRARRGAAADRRARRPTSLRVGERVGAERRAPSRRGGRAAGAAAPRVARSRDSSACALLVAGVGADGARTRTPRARSSSRWRRVVRVDHGVARRRRRRRVGGAGLDGADVVLVEQRVQAARRRRRCAPSRRRTSVPSSDSCTSATLQRGSDPVASAVRVVGGRRWSVSVMRSSGRRSPTNARSVRWVVKPSRRYSSNAAALSASTYSMPVGDPACRDAGRGRRRVSALPSPSPWKSGCDGDHVDLAERPGRLVAVDLRPAERGEAAVALVEEEPVGIEPRLVLALAHASSIVQPPCSGWSANAALLTSSQRPRRRRRGSRGSARVAAWQRRRRGAAGRASGAARARGRSPSVGGRRRPARRPPRRPTSAPRRRRRAAIASEGRGRRAASADVERDRRRRASVVDDRLERPRLVRAAKPSATPDQPVRVARPRVSTGELPPTVRSSHSWSRQRPATGRRASTVGDERDAPRPTTRRVDRVERLEVAHAVDVTAAVLGRRPGGPHAALAHASARVPGGHEHRGRLRQRTQGYRHVSRCGTVARRRVLRDGGVQHRATSLREVCGRCCHDRHAAWRTKSATPKACLDHTCCV